MSRLADLAFELGQLGKVEEWLAQENIDQADLRYLALLMGRAVAHEVDASGMDEETAAWVTTTAAFQLGWEAHKRSFWRAK